MVAEHWINVEDMRYWLEWLAPWTVSCRRQWRSSCILITPAELQESLWRCWQYQATKMLQWI